MPRVQRCTELHDSIKGVTRPTSAASLLHAHSGSMQQQITQTCADCGACRSLSNKKVRLYREIEGARARHLSYIKKTTPTAYLAEAVCEASDRGTYLSHDGALVTGVLARTSMREDEEHPLVT